MGGTAVNPALSNNSRSQGSIAGNDAAIEFWCGLQAVDYYHRVNPTELVRQFLADLLRLPVLFKLFVLYAIGAWVWKWLKAKRQARVIAESANWPVYTARVVWAQVSDRKYEGEDGPSYIECVLTYSYTVPGHDLEVGEFCKRFDDEEEANAWARALRDTFIDVRVDPADATRSVWQETPIPISPAPLEPQLESSILRENEAWGLRNALATGVFCVAAVGTFFAAWIQLSCLTGKPLISAEANVTAFFGMHTGAIVCAIAITFITKQRKWSRSMWRKSLESGTTGIVTKILGFYATVVVLYGWVRMAAHDGDAGNLGTLMFSALWLVFYVGAAAAALQAMQERENDPS